MTINYNASAWLKERTLIRVSDVTLGNQVKLQSTRPSITSYYDVDVLGNVTIDVTDLLRVAYFATGSDLEIEISEWNGQSEIESQSVDIVVKGLTNPSGWLMPTHPNTDGYNQVYISVCPPTMVLQPITGIQSLITMYNTDDCPDNPDYYYSSELHHGERIHSLHNTLSIGSTIRLVTLYKVIQGGSRQMAHIDIKPLTCGRRYVAVEWQDRLGLTKRTTWELRNVVENTLDAVAMQVMDNQYDTRKGAEITATLHLSNLSAYDVWYYADIVTSSRVLMQMSAADTPVQVDVTTKKVDIPNGDAAKELYSLDVQIKYKRYDTI